MNDVNFSSTNLTDVSSQIAFGTFESFVITLFTGLQDAGALGIIFYGIGFTLWVFLTVPSTLVELCAGFIWGAPLATAVGACAKTIGCTLTFLLGRKIGTQRNWKAPQVLLNRWPSGEHQIARTLLFIFVMRFAPLPLAMKNIGLALIPEVTWWEFVFATGIWNIATSSLWSVLGGSASSLLEATRAREVLSTYRANAIAGAMRHPIYFALLLFILIIITGYLLRRCFEHLCMCSKGFHGHSDGGVLKQPLSNLGGAHRYHPVQTTSMQELNSV